MTSRIDERNLLRMFADSGSTTDRQPAEQLLRLQHDVLALIASGGALSLALNELCRLVEEMVPGSLVTVMLLDEADGCLHVEAGPSVTPEIVAAFEGLQPAEHSGSCGAAAYRKQPVIVSDTSTSPHWAALQDVVERFNLRACWSIPILDEQGDALGTFAISQTRVNTPGSFHHRLLETASHLASIAIRRHRDGQQLQLTQFSVDRSRTAIYWMRPDSRMIYVNDAACQALGYTRDELLTMSVPEITPRITAESWPQVVKQIERQGYWHVESVHRRKDGTLFPVEVLASPLELEGQRFHVAYVQDITERKRAEETLRQSRENLAHVNRLTTMGEMASGIAHELNQPLAAVTNYAFVLETLAADDEPDLARIRELSAGIREQAVRAGKIVSSLRGLVKKTATSRSDADVNAIVRKTLALLEPELRHGAIEVQESLDGQLPSVFLDGVLIQQALVNLVCNATEALQQIDPTQRRLLVATARLPSGEVEIRVEDSGPGVAESALETIFDAFHSTKPNGMGMGLAISRSIAEAHAGRLVADRSPLGGLRFRLVLPANTPGRDG